MVSFTWLICKMRKIIIALWLLERSNAVRYVEVLCKLKGQLAITWNSLKTMNHPAKRETQASKDFWGGPLPSFQPLWCSQASRARPPGLRAALPFTASFLSCALNLCVLPERNRGEGKGRGESEMGGREWDGNTNFFWVPTVHQATWRSSHWVLTPLWLGIVLPIIQYYRWGSGLRKFNVFNLIYIGRTYRINPFSF